MPRISRLRPVYPQTGIRRPVLRETGFSVKIETVQSGFLMWGASRFLRSGTAQATQTETIALDADWCSRRTLCGWMTMRPWSDATETVLLCTVWTARCTVLFLAYISRALQYPPETLIPRICRLFSLLRALPPVKKRNRTSRESKPSSTQ